MSLPNLLLRLLRNMNTRHAQLAYVCARILLLPMQECHVLSMTAVSTEHVALGCPSGIKLLAAASLETVAELAVPAGSAHGRIEACAFSPDGGTLLASTGGAELLSFSVHDPRQPVLLRQQHQGHRCWPLRTLGCGLTAC